MARTTTYDLGDGAFTMPATESIDESLSRLARQDARRVADGGLGLSGLDGAPTAFAALRARAPSVDRLRRTPPRARASGASAGRQAALRVVRWAVILGAAWFFLRFFLR